MSEDVKPSAMSRLGVGLMLLIVGLGCGAIIAVTPDIAAAILVLLLPGIISLLIDPTPGRGVGRTILLFQAAASVGPVSQIWYQCDGLNACVSMATDRRTVLVVMLAGGFGFVLTLILPMILKVVDDGRMQIRRSRLVEERQKLVDEWEMPE
jgi:hypothetical protein